MSEQDGSSIFELLWRQTATNPNSGHEYKKCKYWYNLGYLEAKRGVKHEPWCDFLVERRGRIIDGIEVTLSQHHPEYSDEPVLPLRPCNCSEQAQAERAELLDRMNKINDRGWRSIVNSTRKRWDGLGFLVNPIPITIEDLQEPTS